MPPVLSQDSLGLCFSYATATIMNYENCRVQKTDCTNLKDENAFSAFDLARFGQSVDGAEAEYESSYRGIVEGGPGGHTLEIAALFVGSSASEACHSLDKILQKMGGASGLADPIQIEAFERLRKHYEKFKGVKLDCESCVTKFFDGFRKDMCNQFQIPDDNARLLKIFSEESVGKFFDRFFYPKECQRAKNRAYFEGQKTMEIGLFPMKKLKESKSKNYQASINKIKEVLKSGHPLMLQNVCLEERTKGKCPEGKGHAVVVSGYKKMCDGAGKCYDALRVQNSWGQAWQNEFNGGWISAQEALDSTNYEDEFLVWLQDKKGEGS
ncbi:hypothetical protein [Bdellovibrio sp. HCB2-146]|uniref:hypothetical protein n=1 Tax=Bdellovibrio sp. HCB2-146 TaxID=3394362 RepID=UPI0039BC875D